MADKIEIENVNHPGKTERVDRAKFMAMKEAFLSVLPEGPPGLTLAETKEAMRPILNQELFPGGSKMGWWLMAVQLDQAAKGVIVRETTKPMRLHRKPA